MAVKLKGDKEFENILSTKDKALRINLNENIYGTFSEIGAGQEVARHFFRAGGASGTIAKTMSAYDKGFSDAIYGIENDLRYVTQSRLTKMLNHEINLLESRVDRVIHTEKMFFSFANTVATIDFAKKYKGHGWMGIKFQTESKAEYSEIKLHVRFHLPEAKAQQEILGLMGVNLIYGAYYKHNKPRSLIKYLYDHIDPSIIEIDTINFSGPLFKDVDNRLLSLELIKNGMTQAVMFGPDGKNILPAAELYKKNILTIRGSFRPVTKVNEDMYEKSLKMIKKDKKLTEKNTISIFEITLSNLTAQGKLDEQDFLDRAILLCSMGKTVMITNFQEYYKLSEYFSNYTNKKVFLTMGVDNLIKVFDENYYSSLDGGILEAFSKLFIKNITILLYPMLQKNKIINSSNLVVSKNMKNLYKYFIKNLRILDISDYNRTYLSIFSWDVLKKIQSNQKGWESSLPDNVSDLIKQKKLFGIN
ncbi:MAG: nicotinate-nucleotide adenylyltransferase [Flavobacteriaceae bacterium]|nr:nicotinate-nucleotide adenylyltransferase [Flavobacteriaceae bacterium]